MENYYAVLGVSRDADPGEIRRAYHKAARRFHPDTNPDPAATELFIKIQDAYEILSDSERRAEYDQSLPDEVSISGIKINTLYSRDALNSTSEPQLMYALLEVEAKVADEDQTSPPFNLSIVLDRSTSMQGARMDVVKAAARQLIRQLRPKDILSVVTFSDRAEVVIPAAFGLDQRQLEARISFIKPGGGTEIFQGLKVGVQQVTYNLKPSYINHVILITDGRTYGDEEQTLNLAGGIREKGIAISALGIGSDWNDSFLDEIAGRTGGSSMFVSDPNGIKKWLEEKVRGISQIYASGVKFEYHETPEVDLRYAFRLKPEPGKLTGKQSILLGNVLYDQSLKVLFEFLVKQISPEVEMVSLVNGSVKMEIPSRSTPSFRRYVDFTLPVNENEQPYSPPQEIVAAMSKLTLYRMQERAKADLEAGNIYEATNRLKNMATHLLSEGEVELASEILNEVNHIEREHVFSETGEKRIKYGTRALLLPPEEK